jgi:hypothetical protein
MRHQDGQNFVHSTRRYLGSGNNSKFSHVVLPLAGPSSRFTFPATSGRAGKSHRLSNPPNFQPGSGSASQYVLATAPGFGGYHLAFEESDNAPKEAEPVLIDQVRITREGNDAIIDCAESTIAATRLTVGPDIATMTDREIIDVFNGILHAQERLLAAWDKTVTEEPLGRNKSTITKIAVNGCRAATCCAASSTTARRTGKSSSISTTRSYRSESSAGCSACTPDGA